VVFGFQCLAFPFQSYAQEPYTPSWYPQLTSYLSEQEWPYTTSKSFDLYRDIKDARLSYITKLVSTDKKGGIADLILYYENLMAALHLFADENLGASFAYKAKAMKHLEKAVAEGLIEARIELANLTLDGVFVPHDYEQAVQEFIRFRNHPAAYSSVYDYSTIQDYLTISESDKVLKERPYRSSNWTNEILEFYGTMDTVRGIELTRKYGPTILRDRKYPVHYKAVWLDEYYNNTVHGRCYMLLLHEAEVGHVDAYRKMERCAGGQYEDYQYFEDGLRIGIRKGQTHYLNSFGKSLLFDNNKENDAEGLEYLKLAVQYGYYGSYTLAQYFNFQETNIRKCQQIIDDIPQKWKEMEMYISVDQSGRVINVEDKYFEIVVTLPWGCFENTGRINETSVQIINDKKKYQYGIRFRVYDDEYKEECFEFVNARVPFHQDYSRVGSVIASKQIGWCAE